MNSSSPSPTSSPASGYSQTQSNLLFAWNLVELAIHLCLDCPFSALNFVLIWRTAILHFNLKCILLCQSACILWRGIARVLLNICRFGWNDFGSAGPMYLIMLYSQPVIIRNVILNVLVIERIMATVQFRHYEGKRSWGLHICWLTIISFVALLNGYFYAKFQSAATIASIISYGIFTLLGIFELALFWWILRRNQKIYAQKIADKHNLSQRFQLSENIRTAKQLIPCLILHFLNILLSDFNILVTTFRLYGPDQFYYDHNIQVVYIVTSIVSFLIELTMIITHPFLKRDFLSCFWALKSNLKIEHRMAASKNAIFPDNNFGMPPSPQEHLIVNLGGERMIPERNEDLSDQYFRQFNLQWNSIE